MSQARGNSFTQNPLGSRLGEELEVSATQPLFSFGRPRSGRYRAIWEAATAPPSHRPRGSCRGVGSTVETADSLAS